MSTQDILNTRLNIPPTRPELVPRPTLIERLNAWTTRKLTLISAPAGFGKTTLVTEWLDNVRGQTKEGNQAKNKIAWLSLDEGDNDLARFLTYFIAALNRAEGIEATVGEGSLSMLQSQQPLATEVVLTPLINEIGTIPDKIIFVLDDYHLIDAKPIHDALSFLLENLPPQMHLVIATREDPHLPISRLRARGQLTELRAADLRFTTSEAAEFLNQVMGLSLSTEDIAALETRTEGWIAGLQLAAISLQGKKDTTKLIKSFSGSHHLVLDYLIEEVLDQQPESVQAFLLRTSILDRLTGSLCDALTGQENGQQTLEYLVQANLFVVPLDEERRWYRYHHLFADLLRQRLQQTRLEQIPTIHFRASEWYEQKNLLSDAIRHSLAAEDFVRVASLAELAWPAWSGNLQSITWLDWVDALPEELVRARPVLCVAYAQALLNAGKLESAETRLLDAEGWLEPTTEMSDRPEASSIKMVVVDEEQFRALPAWLATTRAYHAQAIGDVRGTVKYVGRALDLFPDDDYYNRAVVTGLLGLAHWASGDLEAAHRTFSNGLFQNVHDLIKGTFVLADMKMTLGQLHEAEIACEHGLKLAKEYDEPMPIGTEDVYSGISEIHREQGYLETAVQDLQMCKKLGEQVEFPDWQYRYCIAQSKLDVSMGNLGDAIDLLEEAARVYVRTPLPEIRPIAAMKARVWVKQDRLTEALAWTRERDLSVDNNLSYLREFEHITLAKVLIAQNREDGSVHEAIGLLDRLLKAAEEGGRMGSVIEILVLLALAHHAQSDIPRALVSLERALTLAEPEGYLRIFVDEGPPMEALLKRMKIEDRQMKEYVRMLLDVFADKKVLRSSLSPQPLIEPLSDREIEILQLIAEGLTNQEISSRLYISLNTVKTHARNIYGKLGVHNRTQAVTRARELEILPSS